MTHEEAVADDALKQLGLGVSLFHVRCVAAFQRDRAGSLERSHAIHQGPQAQAETRLKSDLYAGSLDSLHGQAQWLDAEVVASRRGIYRGEFPRELPMKDLDMLDDSP